MDRWFLRHKRYALRPKKNLKLILLPLFLIFLSVAALIVFDQKILPAAMTISHIQAKAQANQVIDSSIQETIEQMKVTSSDFFAGNMTTGMNAFSVNTILINELCSRLSVCMTNKVMNISDEKITVPLGALTGTGIFSNLGPEIPFYIRPMGQAQADYETSFVSVGINQTNFRIWLNVRIEIQIVNPLSQEKVLLTRKIMLVDTVIHGEVPSQYLDLGGQNKNTSPSYE